MARRPKAIATNRYKSRRRRTTTDYWQRWLTGLRLLLLTGYVAGLSLGLVLAHDWVTQSAYFKAVAIEVEGNRRLTDRQVLEQVRIVPGQNILAVNLRTARKRLLAHPWIAEARVRRQIPDRVDIQIEEHRPAALIDMGRRYVIDEKGTVFKKATSRNALKLPEIVGLRYADLKLDPDTDTMQRLEPSAGTNAGANRHGLMQAALAVLNLGQTANSVIPVHEIRRIQVDPQLGLTVVAFDTEKTIKLGFGNYSAKYMMLKQVMVLLRQNKLRGIPDFGSIDLAEPDRIVMRPVQDQPTAGN